MGDPKPLTAFSAAAMRRRHRRDWTYDPDATAGDIAVKVRRRSPPELTNSLRRLSTFRTGGEWDRLRLIDLRTGRLVIANVAGRCVGYAYGIDDLEHGEGSCMLDDVVVEPEFRSRGIGHAVIAELAAWYLEDKHSEMWGLPRGSAAAAGGLGGWYERQGFQLRARDDLMRGDIVELVERTKPFRASAAN